MYTVFNVYMGTYEIPEGNVVLGTFLFVFI